MDKAVFRTQIAAVSGLWYTENREGAVELYACGAKVCGRLYWLQPSPEDPVSLDTRNPDPDKRSRPLCRLQFMGDFEPEGAGRFTDGWIYSPRHGATFSANMHLITRDRLDLHGYIFFPFLGESQIWTRANDNPSPCTYIEARGK